MRSPHSTRPPPPPTSPPPPQPPRVRAAAAAVAREAAARGVAARAAPPVRVRALLLRPGARPPRLAGRRLAARRARRSAKAPRDRCRDRALRPRCRDLPQCTQQGGSRGQPPRRGQRGRRARGSDAPRRRSTTMICPQPRSSPELIGLDRVSHHVAAALAALPTRIRACPSRVRARTSGGVIQYTSNTVRLPYYTEF